ncbi:MAG: PAS domain S-box protein [Elusimicrobia bacterium]|nr:PAS domain S-box protein [Elusimicrobiota bacterium]
MKTLWRKIVQGLSGISLNALVTLLRGRTLSRRILAPVLPAVIAVSVFFGVFSYWMVRRQIVISVRQVMTSEAANAARSLEGFFQQRLNDLDAVCETPLIADYNKNRVFGLGQEAALYRRELQRYFKSFSQRSKVYYDIAYVSAVGDRVCSLRPSIDPDRYRNSFPANFLDLVRSGKRFDPSFQRAEADGPVIKRYAKPVFDEAGVFLGAIVTDCDMTPVEDLLRGVKVADGGATFMEDMEGNPLLGKKSSRAGSLFRGEMAIHELEPPDRWRVVVTAPSREYLAEPLRNIFWSTIISSVVGLLFLSFLIVHRVSDLMEPIHELVEGTQRFASGDLHFRFPGLKSLELDLLASSFNRMAETLEARSQELEKRLRQATALRDMEESVIQRQDEETVLRTCLESVARGFAFDRTGLYWVDSVHKEIVGRYLFGSDGAGFTEMAFKKRRVPLGGDDILNDVIRNRQSVVVNEPGGDSRVNPAFVTEARSREFCMAPICGKDRVLGIITADNYDTQRPFTEADREGLMLFANAVGLALENAFLFHNLAESESKLRTVLENSPEAIIGLSREQWIGTWNRGAEKIFGYSCGEALGKPIALLFPKNAGDAFKKLLNEVMEKGWVRDFPLPGQSKDGRPLELSLSWGGQHSDFWMNKEWTVVIRDVTEARRLQQQLIRSEKLSAVGQLISGIAHELNNPLQAVVGYSDILSEDMKERLAAGHRARPLETAEVAKDVRIIMENAMRCQKIIENLLMFVRQGDLEKRAVDLAEVVRAARELLDYKLRKSAHVDVDVDIPKNIPFLKGNLQQVQQIFLNLMNNACDAMTMSDKPGPKRLSISVKQTHSGALRIEITDTGPGIPVYARDHVFDAFFTTKPEGRGTGLGLPVCRQIVEENGGRIGFETEIDRGTTFWIDWPATTEAAPGLAKEKPALPASVRGKAILLVDDEPDVLGFLSKVIQSEGNRLEVASSLKEAIATAAKAAFDLVVTDVRLGEGTGLSLYENWGLWSPHPRPAFMFMTGDVLTGTIVSDIEARGLTLLRKPIDLSTFQAALRNALTLPGTPLNPTPPKR